MAKEYKNNIFDVLKHIDNKEYNYYETLSEEQQKDIQPYTITRWMSSIAGDENKHIRFTKNINDYVNKHFWEIAKFKDLQMKLLASCGQSGWNKHQWIGLPKNTPKDKYFEALKQEFNNLDDETIHQMLDTMDDKEKKNFLKMVDEKIV